MRLAALLLAATILAPQQTVAPPPSPPFEQWLRDLIAEARARGFGDDLIDATLSGITPVQRVVERDNSQAEFTITLDRYFETRVTPRIIRLGRAQLMEERAVLRNIRTAYGVSPGVVLAMLAYAPRRSDFFRSELFKALAIVSGGYIDAKTMTGSWAGAMGQPQFMPSSYLEHAVDFDNDGLRDIWHSDADTLASIASYLKAYGWETGQIWGREVRISRVARENIADIPLRDAGC